MSSRLELLLQYYAEDPHDAFTRFALATEYIKKGELGKGLEWFVGLTKDQPDYVGTYYHLGKLYEQLERTDEAILTYEQGIRVAQAANDLHARAELQSALLEAQGLGFDE